MIIDYITVNIPFSTIKDEPIIVPLQKEIGNIYEIVYPSLAPPIGAECYMMEYCSVIYDDELNNQYSLIVGKPGMDIDLEKYPSISYATYIVINAEVYFIGVLQNTEDNV